MRMRTIFALFSLFVVCAAGPTDPVPKPDQWWINRHESFKANTAHNPGIPILFYGDSITQGWYENGRSIFDHYYAPLGVANYGISADKTEHVLWRILNGEIQGLNPKLVVLKIGTNNLDTDGNQAIANGIVNIVRILREKLPNTKVLLLGILPRTGATNFDRISVINKSICKLHDGQNVFFLDMFDKFRSVVWGAVPSDLFYDGLHLSTSGYQLWANSMNPLFD